MFRKKVFAVLLCVAILLPVLPLSVFAAETVRYEDVNYDVYTEGDYEFIVVGNEAYIVKYNGSAASLTTPATLGSKPVVKIWRKSAYNAKGAFEGNTVLQTVTIGAGINSIADSSFSGCSSLRSVTFASGTVVNGIGAKAFDGCSSLNNFVIPNTVKSIGDCAFQSCSSLSAITIPDTVTSLGGGVFFNCQSLKIATIGNGAMALPFFYKPYSANWGDNQHNNGFFEGCISLTTITLGTNLLELGDDCFAGTALTEIKIPNSVTTIGSGAFYDNKYLAAASIGNSVFSIGERAFDSCLSLQTITIPNSTKNLGAGMFFNCQSLETAIIGNGATTLPYFYKPYSDNWGGSQHNNGFFEGCVNLTKVTLGSGLHTIGYDCFAGTALKEITVPDNVVTIEGGAFYNCKDMKKAILGEAVIYINECAFYNNESLVSVAIGDRVLSIGDQAFGNCLSLTEISIPSSVTSLGGGMFFNCSSLKTVIIGNGATALPFFYKAYNANWGGNQHNSGFFEGCVKLTSVTLGSSLRTIGYDCFAGTPLTAIVLPARVAEIEAYAFANKNFSSIYFAGDYPFTVNGDAFKDAAPVLGNALTVYYINGKTRFDNYVGTKATYTPVTVSFDNNNANIIAATTDDQIFSSAGGYVINPVAPAAIDYVFGGWYTNAACSDGNKWDFVNSKATASMTLYAKWDKASDVIPVRPTNLQTSGESGNSVTVSWDAVSGATGYNIYVDGVKSNSTAVTDSSYTIMNLDPNTTYEVHVVATNSLGSSPDSLIVVARTTSHIHSFGEWAERTAANCVTEGLKYRVCTDADCGAEETQATEKLSTHNLGEWAVRTAATTSAAGLKFRKCADCDYEETEVIPKLSAHTHNFGTWMVRKAATCAAEGVDYRKCSECNEEETRSTAKTTAHSYGGWSVVTAATADIEGSKVRTCAVCSKQETASIPKIGSVPEAIEFSNDISFTVADDKIKLSSPMTAAELLAQILTNTVELRDKNGNVLSGAALVGTGATLSLIGGNDTYTVILMGDVNGDGKIQTTDARMALRAAVSIEPLSGVYYDAANVPPSAGVKTSSARKILRVAVKIDEGF